MGSLLGFPLAMPLGGVSQIDVHILPLGGRVFRVEWVDPNPPAWDTSYMLSVDGKHYTSVPGQTSMDIIMDDFGTPQVEMVRYPANAADPGFFILPFFSTPKEDRIQVTWAPPASVVDVAKYRIYFDNTTGTVTFDDAGFIGEVLEDGQDSYEIWTDPLTAGTYKFVVRTVDEAGNESTNTTATSQVLTIEPGVITSFALSYDEGTDKATLTWVDPSDIGGGDVEIYDNLGDASKLYPDYADVVATIPAGTQTFLTAALTEGVWVFGARVSNGSVQEINGTITVTVRLDSSEDEVSGFPPKPGIQAANDGKGMVRLLGTVNPDQAVGEATQIKFYTNDGAGGAVDFITPIATVNLLQQPPAWSAEFLTIEYGETARIFAARAVTAGGVESVNSDDVTITPDATEPPQPLSVASAVGRD